MRRLIGTTLSALTLGLAATAQAQAPAAPAAPAMVPASSVHRDAREQAPAGLIGLWKADMALSTYSGAKPKSALRSFAYTADGKILVTFMTVGANGNYSTGHWAAQPDGTDSLEYHSAAGSTPYNIVRLTKVDDKNLDVQIVRFGKPTDRYHYTLSDDLKTLTYTYPNNKIVYRKWEGMDW
jgi:hypothetical protein